jgi:hypothetical protein
VHVLRRHRRELAPEVVERVAVEAPGGALELRRVDQVRCAELRDVYLEVAVLADEDSRGARVVEVDVAQEQMADVREREPVLAKALLERRDAARGAAVEEREAGVGLEEVGADDALGALVAEVD